MKKTRRKVTGVKLLIHMMSLLYHHPLGPPVKGWELPESHGCYGLDQIRTRLPLALSQPTTAASSGPMLLSNEAASLE
jgi:hypothetical protein